MLQTMTATVRSLEGLQVEAEARGFKFTMDEPEDLVGTNTGMNPVEALLCALGACQVIVIKAFADARRFNVKNVRVELEGDLDPDGFLGKNPDVRNGFSEIRFTFYLETDENEERTRKFIDFVEKKCPVGDIIANGVPMIRSGIVTE